MMSAHTPPPPSPRRRGPASAACLLAGCILLLSAGCATAPPPPTPTIASADLYDDAGFKPASVPVDPKRVFALDEAMQGYVRDHAPSQLRTGWMVREEMLDDLFTRGRLKLDYESTRTRTASEAYAARRGNCLSLVILTGALAHALGIDVTYHAVDIEPAWSRASGLYFLNTHVNVVLGVSRLEHHNRLDYEITKAVDFLPMEDQGGRRTHVIEERTVLAMFMNNRAAESLVDGRVDDAYWFAREAVRQDPAFLAAYNTLAVVYLRHHDAARAETVLRRVATLTPRNTQVLANLAQSLDDQGRADEAARLREEVARIEPVPPFHWFVLGQLAMSRGDYAKARDEFRKELAREPDYHEFHFWLAQAEFKLGDVASARRHLTLARDDSTRDTDRALYAAKLDRLRAAGL